MRPLAIRLLSSIPAHDPVARAGQSRHPIDGDLETDACHLSTERLTARGLIDDPTVPCADVGKRFAQRPNDPRIVATARLDLYRHPLVSAVEQQVDLGASRSAPEVSL